MKRGVCEYNYVEVMACPSGCLNGGGQLKAGQGQSQQQLLDHLDTIYHDPEALSPFLQSPLEAFCDDISVPGLPGRRLQLYLLVSVLCRLEMDGATRLLAHALPKPRHSTRPMCCGVLTRRLQVRFIMLTGSVARCTGAAAASRAKHHGGSSVWLHDGRWRGIRGRPEAILHAVPQAGEDCHRICGRLVVLSELRSS